jgi:intracellular multiplication protein IcmS
LVNFSQTLELVSKEMNIGFSLHNKAIDASDVFAETGLLPAILRRADQLCSFCFGYGLGVSFDESDGTRLGVRVNFNNEVPNVLRVMCAVEIMFELMEAAPNRTRIALDDLMYD